MAVYRVSWLKAKACYDRWSEELKLVRYEMGWSVEWYRSQEKEWRQRADDAWLQDKDGHQAYAEKQVKMWQAFREMASRASTAMLATS